ncbi:MAG TPA: LppP/LprE family lipoprotein [Candidatus Corynebacterium avicola]|uniref:LppP/LprE family lipoprotein n=1 Tax=Candidatus Corynebacterium avicola TaxID=2838527 RepID=A0A9D1RP48_9CORY|nr:LppP/LprE family lipoprotein [Candidatus Corynebacterium avicola]
MTIQELSRRFACASAATILLATGVTACSDTGSGADGSDGSGDGAPNPTAASDSSDASDCDQPELQEMDLVDTEFGHVFADGRVATTGEQTFHFEIDENMFDACQDLSWVVLDGQYGDMPERDESEPHLQTVVLFAGEDAVNDPAPLMMENVEEVTRAASNELTVSYGDGMEVTYRVDGGSVTAEDTGDTATPEASKGTGGSGDSLTPIDLEGDPIPTSVALNPIGNAQGSPYAEELDDGYYIVPVSDDLTLECKFDRAGSSNTCQGQGKYDWTDKHGEFLNGFGMGYMPTSIHAEAGNWGQTPFEHTLADGDLTLIGTTAVDTTEDDKVTFRSGDQEVWITPDDFGPESARWMEDEPVMSSTGDSCGTVESSEFPPLDGREVEVSEGSVDCDEALDVMEEYLSTPTDAAHGNANIREFGEWNCAMPTAGSATESNTAASCTLTEGDGAVKIPMES